MQAQSHVCSRAGLQCPLCGLPPCCKLGRWRHSKGSSCGCCAKPPNWKARVVVEHQHHRHPKLPVWCCLQSSTTWSNCSWAVLGGLRASCQVLSSWRETWLDSALVRRGCVLRWCDAQLEQCRYSPCICRLPGGPRASMSHVVTTSHASPHMPADLAPLPPTHAQTHACAHTATCKVTSCAGNVGSANGAVAVSRCCWSVHLWRGYRLCGGR